MLRRSRLWPRAVAVIAAFVPAIAGAQNTALVGDLNFDYQIGALDAQVILSDVVGLRLPPGFYTRPYGDANCDNQIGAVDAAIILARTVGLPTTGLCVGSVRARAVIVSVNPAVPTVGIDGTVQLTAIARDSVGGVLAGRPARWSSADTAIATVSVTGLVTVHSLDRPVEIFGRVEDAEAAALVNGGSNDPAELIEWGGNWQVADPNTSLPNPVTVLVIDRGNNPLPGVPVQFSRSPGDATSPVSGLDTTDANGIASVRWTIRQPSGTHFIVAKVPGLDSTVFVATVGDSINASSGCALATSGAAYCWGLNTFGQVGDATFTARGTPVPVAGLSAEDPPLTFASLAPDMPGDHMCGLLASQAAYCWGANSRGQIGDGTTTNRTRPMLVSGGLTFSKISVGVYHTCAITPAGAAYCWGWNASGQIGDGTTTDRNAPAAVTGGLTFSDISVGLAHTCGVTQSGAAYCWGTNASGMLGDGTFNDSAVPVQVGGPASSFQKISAGAFMTCALGNGDGTAFCWGANANGQLGDGTIGGSTVPFVRPLPQAVSGSTKFSAIRAQYFNACGLATDNSVWCWGSGSSVADGSPSTAPRLVPTQIAGGTSYASLHASLARTCARVSSGTPFCWGFGAAESFGDGGRSGVGSRRLPVPVQWVDAAGGTAAQIQVVAGSGSAPLGAALPTPPGVIVRDAFGAPVAGSSVTFSVVGGGGSITGAVQVTNDTGFARVGSWTLGASVGQNTIAISAAPALSARHSVTAYAAPASKTLGLGDTAMIVPKSYTVRPHFVEVQDAGANAVVGIPVTFTAVNGGAVRVLNVATGVVESFTSRTFLTGATGRAFVTWSVGTTGEQKLAVDIPGLPSDTIRAPEPLTLGVGQHQCARTTAGVAYCWGENSSGQIGNNTTSGTNLSPVAVQGGVDFAALSHANSGDFTCGLSASGAIHCWGGNTFGQLGDGTRSARLVPTPTAAPAGGAPQYLKVVAGTYFACGLANAGTWCWGGNNYGQLGIGSFGGVRETPTAVATPGAFTSITAGSHHACGLLADGSAWCWGSNAFGQLGNGTTVDAASPARVLGVTPFTAIAAGDGFSCALDPQGQAWCWGQAASGTIGTGGTSPDQRLPVSVQQGALHFTSIAAGGRVACALTATGAAYCWGRNDAGQLGNGGTSQQNAPVAVYGGLSFKSIAPKDASTCGFTTANQPYCWGAGAFGQLGNGAATDRNVPTPVTWPEGSPGVPVAIAAVAGNNQVTLAGAALDVGPTVVVLNHLGNPVAGRAVTFIVTSGGGSVSVSTSLSNASGNASTIWTLGATPGANSLEVRVSGVPPVRFDATGLAASATTRLCPGEAGAYTSFGGAAAGTSDGGLLTVCPGIHVVKDVLLGAKSITIEGENASTSILSAGGVGVFRMLTVSNGVNPTSAVTTIRGLRFEGTPNEVIAVSGQYGSVLIEDNTFAGSPNNAAIAVGSAIGTGIVIANNSFAGGNTGISVADGADSLDILDNTFTDVSRSIGLGGASTHTRYVVRIKGNTITGCGSYTCIYTNNLRTFVFEDNVISTSLAQFAAEGVHLEGKDAVATVKRNTIQGTGGTGDRNSTEGYPIRRAFNLSHLGTATLDSNTISNVWQAILFDSVTATVTNSLISLVNNPAGGAAGPNVALMNRNDITDYIYALENGNGPNSFTTANFRCNWWGVATGPTNLGAGFTSAHVEPYAFEAIAGQPAVACNADGPWLSMSSTALPFASTGIIPNPANQNVTVANHGQTSLEGLAVQLIYADGQPTGWLTVDKAANGGGGEPIPGSLGAGQSFLMRVFAASGSLSAGNYSATIRITSTNAPNSPRDVAVTFSVEGPTLSSSVTTISYTSPASDPDPAFMGNSEVSNTGSSRAESFAVDVVYAGGQPTGWLTFDKAANGGGSTTPPTLLNPINGSEPFDKSFTLRVFASRTSLAPGTYNATIRLTSTNAVNSPKTISITLVRE